MIKANLIFSLKTSQDFRDLYYNDVDLIDIELYKNKEWRSEIWSILETAKGINMESMINAIEAEKWNLHILNWYDNAMKHEYKPLWYLDINNIEKFIDDAALEISKYIDADIK